MKGWVILIVAGLFSLASFGQTIMDSSKTIQKMLIGTWVNTNDTASRYVFSFDSLQESWSTPDPNYLPFISKYSIVKELHWHDNKMDTCYGVADGYAGGAREIYLLNSTLLKMDGHILGIEGPPPVLVFKKESDSVHFILKSRRR